MEEHKKLQKLLELIRFLSNGLRYSKAEIMERYDLPGRTADRYIKTIREVGFILPPPVDGRYWIDRESPYFKDLGESLHFSKEEAHILYNAIHAISNDNLLKQNLIRKLYTLYDAPYIAESVVKLQQSTNIHELTRAIKTKSKAVLHGYRSANSDRQTDRVVEPFSFTTNYVSTWAYDIDAGICKTFKNTRVASVRVLNEPQAHEHLHEEGFMDVFRISSDVKIPVKLKLSLRACELLKEEYPLAEKHITPLDENHSLFEATVCSLEGVGRFVLGLCHEIEIMEPESLKTFLKKRVKNFL